MVLNLRKFCLASSKKMGLISGMVMGMMVGVGLMAGMRRMMRYRSSKRSAKVIHVCLLFSFLSVHFFIVWLIIALMLLIIVRISVLT